MGIWLKPDIEKRSSKPADFDYELTEILGDVPPPEIAVPENPILEVLATQDREFLEKASPFVDDDWGLPLIERAPNNPSTRAPRVASPAHGEPRAHADGTFEERDGEATWTLTYAGGKLVRQRVVYADRSVQEFDEEGIEIAAL